jgi:transposase-like protein
MHWPVTPVEHDSSFRPPFCPWPACPAHRNTVLFGYHRKGSFSTRRRRRVPRFRCLVCRRWFSRQTFATSYYLKRPELLGKAAAGLLAGSAHRQIARSLHCAPSTITRLSSRLGRHGLLFLARCLTQLAGSCDEPVVIDHFETFEFTQDYPLGIATAVGARSWFLYAIDAAPHRRAGAVSAAQRRRLRRRPRRDYKGGYTGSTHRLFTTLTRLAAAPGRLHVIGDGHRAYQRVAGRFAGRLSLESHPNPPRGPRGSPRSRQAVVRDRAMFPVDALHALTRHSMAHHRRETIAFGRRINALMERFFLATAWRNFIKSMSERRPTRITPAMVAGLTERPWSWRRVLGRRLFFHHETLPPQWDHLYRRLWSTPLVRNRRHALVNAF